MCLGMGRWGGDGILRNSSKMRGRIALQPISSSEPNLSASGPRMHDYAILAGGSGAAAVQVAPGLLGVRTLVMTTAMSGGAAGHATTGGPASASVPFSVSRSVSGAPSSRRSDSKSTTSTTSSNSASEDADIDIDIDVDGNIVMKTLILTAVVFIVSAADTIRTLKLMWREWKRVVWMKKRGGVVSDRPMSRVR